MRNKRVSLLIVLAFIAVAGLIARLYQIQILNHEQYLIEAKRRHIGTDTIKADRGMILDRNRIILAITDPVKSFYVAVKQAKKNKSKGSIAKQFALITGKDSAYYFSLMDTEGKRVCLERVSDTLAVKLSKVKKGGLYAVNEPVRFYPANSLASHLIGFADKRLLTGRDGIERMMDSVLRGEDGTRTIMRDAKNNMISVIDESTVPPVQGHTVVTTIDKDLQELLEAELDSGVTANKAGYVLGIVMDPFTGEILALANKRDYDLNRYGSAALADMRNHAVCDMYEPASTMKALSFAAFFDKGICKEDETVFCENGVYNVMGAELTDSKPHGNLSIRDVFVHSSNIGTFKIAQRIDAESFYKYMRGFGIGTPTGLGLPSEARGSLSVPDNWSRLSKGVISYGYEVMVTPVQLISAYASIINGGLLMQPQIVKRVESADGKIVSEFQPKVIRQTISAATSERMIKLMQAVVTEGTARGIHCSELSFGGKTGTSHIYQDNKRLDKYNSWFVGFFPAEKPKYLCLILAHNPQGAVHFGGDVAAPIFKKFALRVQMLEPETMRQFAAAAISPSKAAKIVFSAAKAQKLSAVVLPTTKNIMPDLTGKAIRDAALICSALGIEYKINGFHRVRSQSIPPGTAIKPGIRCSLQGTAATFINAGVAPWN